MTRPSPFEEGDALREYVEIVRRQVVVVVMLTIVGLAAALTYSFTRPPIYTAHAEVLVQPPTGIPQGVRVDQAVSMDTEARVVASAPIAEQVRRSLGWETPIADLLDGLSVATTPDTLVLDIAFSARSPTAAARGADAFAESYLDFRRDRALNQIDQQRSAIEGQIAALRAEERRQLRLLVDLPPGSATYREARAALDRIQVQLAVLTSQLTSLPMFVDAGEMILPASPPSSPSSPKHPINAAIGLFLGFFLGITGAAVRDRLDDRIRDRRDLANRFTVPILAVVPHLRARHGDPRSWVVVETDPRSPAAEAFRTVRTTVLSLCAREDARVVAIVSALQGEGKSITAANLGAALGHAGKRTLIVSVDLRKPSIHDFFGVPNDAGGLAEVVSGTSPLRDVLTPTGIPGVSVLPAGNPPANPAELLHSTSVGRLLAALREAYDVVILDCPPVLGLADTLSVIPFTDLVLFVVRSGRSRLAAITDAIEHLERVDSRPNGIILNDVRRRGQARYGYGYYAAPAVPLTQSPEPAIRGRSAPRAEPVLPATDPSPAPNGDSAGEPPGGDQGSSSGADQPTQRSGVASPEAPA